MKVMAVVILYHPDAKVLGNIKTYLDDVEQLLILDNSEQGRQNSELAAMLSELPHSRYIAFGDNLGISYALNYALKQADGYDYLLTMDQDSSFSAGMVEKYKQAIIDFPDKKVAMFAGNYDHKTNNISYKYEKRSLHLARCLRWILPKRLVVLTSSFLLMKWIVSFAIVPVSMGTKLLCFMKCSLYINLAS